MSIINHEVCETHIMASLKIKLSTHCLPILPSLTKEHNRQVSFNRDGVKQLIEITIFLAKHNLSFRGHDECWKNDLKGNFKDMVVLLAQYSATLSVHTSNLKSNARKEYSFISWERQNLLIESVAEYELSVIKSQINSAELFSICRDSTFDVSHKEQLSFIVRYIFDGKIHERLLALTKSSTTTGEALFQQFKSVMERNNLDWKNNLLANYMMVRLNMRGTYNGLQARILEMNPKALYIWCYAYRLNLIILTAVGLCTEAIDLFGDLEKLYTFINCSKKRADLYSLKQS
ncbi:zinc finger MYM-type protein 1-like [Rhopalosiphum maidis]|uniref:zinc finger MYM-type protein 1-like n=1 Tax=Rhopalosiphum maidis TaxID=43146 RepID=UPI000F00E42A|nr:zinc finger MYM-type protein 1-like [Rhopalosiphum maidis]